MIVRPQLTQEFVDLLRAQMQSESEAVLYRASELGRELVTRGIGPDALVAIHHAAVQRVIREQPASLLPTVVDKASHLLLEAMMAYSLAYREHQRAEKQRFEQMRLYNEQLERHERELRAIFNSALDGLILLDRYERVRLINPPAMQLIRLPSDEVVGRPFPTDRLPFDGARLREALREVRVGGDTAIAWDVEVGQRAWHVTVVPVDQDGQFFGTLTVLRDRSSERELDRMKDELLGLGVHEIRAPLGLMLGFADLIRTRELSPATVKEYATIISQTAEHLNGLIKDFLLIHRLESGVISHRPAPLDLGRLCRTVVERFAATTDRHHLVVDVPGDLPSVRADAERLTEVLTNLLSNAIKYSPRGGEIRVEAKVAGAEVVVSVADQGLGLAPEDITHLFAKFYRVPSPDRQEIEGTGLGLAICRQIVEIHGGRIWADSPGPGQGSRFTFTLPISPSGA